MKVSVLGPHSSLSRCMSLLSSSLKPCQCCVRQNLRTSTREQSDPVHHRKRADLRVVKVRSHALLLVENSTLLLLNCTEAQNLPGCARPHGRAEAESAPRRPLLS